MRRLALTLGVLALLLPAAAGAVKRGPGDGTLVVDNANGLIILNVKGGIIGRVDYGTIVVGDPVEGDGQAPVVKGWQERVRLPGPNRWQYTCEQCEIRFRLIGGLYRVRIDAIGIDLSIVGKGTAVLDGTGYADQSGRYSLNGAGYQSFPHTRTQFTLGSPQPATLGSK
jgi:hypothetical protein